MDPNDWQKMDDKTERKWTFLKSLSKRWFRHGGTKRANEIAVKENQNLPILQLPDELLIKIIESMPIAQWASLELVSRRFQIIVHGLWGQLREIRLDELVLKKKKKPYQIVEAALRKFIIRAPNVALIGGFYEYFDQLTSISMSTIRLLSNFQHLQTIDFSGSFVISVSNFAAFLMSSASRESWKRLDIVGGIYDEWMESQIAVASKNQPALNLEHFKVSMAALYVFDRFLPPIDWSGLKKLVLVGNFNSAKDVLPIIYKCTRLTHLEIEVSECGNGNDQPSCGDFMKYVANLENLSVLKIGGHRSPENAFSDALLGLIQDLGHRGIITNLALVPVSCSDRIVDAIIDHLPRLRSLELDVAKCTTTSLVRLTKRMRELETLKLQSLDSRISGTVVRAIGANMTSLKCLHLDCLKSNSEDLTILADLRKLKELRFSGLGICIQYTDCGTIETWTRLGFGPCLERLELSLDGILDGISAKTMGDFLKNVTRLRWMQLWGVTDAILYAILESCPNLIELNLMGPSTITFAAIQSLIDRCTQLKCLKVSDHHHYKWFPASLTMGKYRKITSKSTFK